MKSIRDLFSRGKKTATEQMQATMPDLTGQTPVSSRLIYDKELGRCSEITFPDGSIGLYLVSDPIRTRAARFIPAKRQP